MARKNSRKMQSTPEENLAEKVRQFFRSRAIGKKCYARSDRLLAEIAKELQPGEAVMLNDRGKKAVLVDPFATKFVAFRPLGFRRYDLEIVEE
jgi:hypothetical protein